MISHRDIWAVFRDPQQTLREVLSHPLPPSVLFIGTVTPLAAIRSIAVLLRSILAGSPMTGIVLGLGSFALQLGAWLGLGLVLPAVARQFKAELTDPQAFVLATYTSIPLWLAGLLYVVPEDPWLVFLWSRGLVLLVALYGLTLMQRGFAVLEINRKIRTPLLASIGIAYFLLYILLFVLVGVAAHVVLFVVAPTS